MIAVISTQDIREQDRGNMVIVTKHISLDDTCVKKVQPYVERHAGNFSSAMRELIDRAEKSGIPDNASAIDTSLFNWMLENVEGKLIPDNILDDIINPGHISIKNIEDHINRRFTELEWNINTSLKYDNDKNLSNIIIEVRGSHPKTTFVSCLLSQYLIKSNLERGPLEIRSVKHFNDSIRVDLYRSDKSKSIDSLTKFFGNMEEIMTAIHDRPSFWKNLVHRHVMTNYNMITVHRNYFEDILLGKTPMGEITIENIAKRPIQDIPMKYMLELIKEVYETSRVADRVDVNGETITIFHNLRDLRAVDKLGKSIVLLLEANGHLYDVRITSNMLVLKHRPDIGVKINEIVNHLKNSNSSVDQELIMFLTFIKGLKEIPDIPLFLTTLGRRIGRTLLREYEKENNVKSWNLENFKKVMEAINFKIQMDCEWKLEGNSLLYRVRKCNIATEGHTIDSYICHTSREVFKGALGYAFGNKAELEIKKLLSHGDNYCEVMIRLL